MNKFETDASHTLSSKSGEQHLFLMDQIVKAIKRFSHFLDHRLYLGLKRLIINSPENFLESRSFQHIRTLLLTQFFLQKKMETALTKEAKPKNILFLKLFQRSSSICIAFALSEPDLLRQDQLLITLNTILPGTQKMPLSSYRWHHPEFSYLFSYLEVHKLRGKEISPKELRRIEKILQEQLLAIPSLTPTLFWPYNEEESYRQIQLLQREMNSSDELPHVSIHFQEQTSTFLEFLIHLVRPKPINPLDKALKQLPDSLQSFCYFHRLHNNGFSIEIGVFSLKVPSDAFNVHDSINLLYARRYVLKYLEKIIGPFRDYNGGLFEKQQQHFETIRAHLSHKIFLFDLFAEKVFYSLHPVETRLSLSLKIAEDLFLFFSEMMQLNESFTIQNSLKTITIIKTINQSDLLRWLPVKERMPHAQLTFGDFHYLCLLGKINSMEAPPPASQKTKTLHLIFEEGAPLSLNPYHSSGDMRSRLLSKLLFEGLTRLNAKGIPELAGAIDVKISQESLLYTFTLRPYRWSNGENITAMDYVTSFQFALNDYMSHPEFLFIIKNARKFKEKQCHARELGIRALKNDLLEMELERPEPFFLHQLTQPFFFPIFGSMKEPKWFNGPYLVRENNKENLILEHNPYFWDTKRSLFEQIHIRWLDDVNTIYKLFQEGKTDWIGEPLSILSPQLIKQLQEEKKMHQRTVSRRFLICFNTKCFPLHSSYIRQALSAAIDRSFICSEIFPESIPLPGKDQALVFFEKGLKELGLTRETFPPLTLSYSHQTRREKLALSLQSNWQNILGIKIHLKKIEWNHFRNTLEKGTFEISGIIQEMPGEAAVEFFERLEGSSSWNFSQWTHLAFREIIANAKQTRNEEQRKNLLDQAKKILAEEVPFTPLFIYTHFFAHHPDLRSYCFDHEGCVDFSWAHKQ